MTNQRLTHSFERDGRHATRKKARADGVDCDVVLAPFSGQSAREIDHCPLGGVVGQGVHAGRVTTQPGNRRQVDDAARLARDHVVLGDVLA